MMSWWRALWPKKRVPPPMMPVLLVGGIYRLHKDDPFTETAIYAEVVEIRDGWVRYRYVDGTRYWSKPINAFLALYSPCIQEA